MSRTYKDKKGELRFPEAKWDFGCERIEYERDPKKCWRWYDGAPITGYWYRDIPGAKTKKKKTALSDWYWLRGTPSWWTHMTFTKPERRKANSLLHKALLSEIEDVDVPDCGKKPHIYYW